MKVYEAKWWWYVGVYAPRWMYIIVYDGIFNGIWM